MTVSSDSTALAPELDVCEWLGTPAPLASSRGRVVLVEAFQMLCPGCVHYGLPQAKRVHRHFPQVAVVGLHTVFEHHGAMTPIALQAFLHEYRIPFPVGVDMPGAEGDPVPRTMRAYALRGTPSLVLIDARGNIRGHHFGQVEDLALGARIASLVHEAQAPGAG